MPIIGVSLNKMALGRGGLQDRETRIERPCLLNQYDHNVLHSPLCCSEFQAIAVFQNMAGCVTLSR